jgi:formylglycine-generating enzyme required for sulfatase activity
MWDGLDEKTGKRVIRGGCWNNDAEGCTAAYRLNVNLVIRNDSIGFRVALGSVP